MEAREPMAASSSWKRSIVLASSLARQLKDGEQL
jgi:hypothetical protein